MSRMLISSEALRLIFRMLVSCCHPLVNSKRGDKHRDYLSLVLEKKVDVYLDDFLEGLAYRPMMYDKLSEIARKQKKNTIDNGVVYQYFGGKVHIQKVAHDFKKENLESAVSPGELARFLLLHLLTPVTITRIQLSGGKPVYTGLYENGSKKVIISGLVAFKEDEEDIREGQIVLSHFSCIIVPHPEKPLVMKILNEQFGNERFRDALSLISDKEINQERLCGMMFEAMDKYHVE